MSTLLAANWNLMGNSVEVFLMFESEAKFRVCGQTLCSGLWSCCPDGCNCGRDAALPFSGQENWKLIQWLGVEAPVHEQN